MKRAQQLKNSTLLTSTLLGSDGWWLEVARCGTPLTEPLANGRWQVTFIWRDPQGCELASTYQRVWININCITDHHQAAEPQSLQRLRGSDVWYWQTELAADWRGSYCFIPCLDEHLPEQVAENAHTTLYLARHWWQKRLAFSTPDLFNPCRAWPDAGGHFFSGLHMPQAPQQLAWQELDNYAITNGRCTPAAPADLQRHLWQSQRLGNTRQVWVYSTGESHPQQRPLAILLDGQFWAQQMPIWQPLMQLTQAGQLPPAVYVLIDVIDQQQRSRELACNEQFWLAVQQELLPQVANWAPHSQQAATTVVAGQSFGGLSALYAALQWPESFAAVISQSGSFWWPRRDLLQLQPEPEDACWLIRQLEQQQLVSHAKLKVFLEAGVHEKLIHQVSDRMATLLRTHGHQVHYRVVAGGHDALCWRGGLLDGLQLHWATKASKGSQPPLSASNNNITQ